MSLPNFETHTTLSPLVASGHPRKPCVNELEIRLEVLGFPGLLFKILYSGFQNKDSAIEGNFGLEVSAIRWPAIKDLVIGNLAIKNSAIMDSAIKDSVTRT